MDVIGERLRELRIEAFLSQEDFAKLIGTTQRQVSRIERGITRINAEIAVAVATHFRVSLDYIFGLSDKRRVEPCPECPEVDPALVQLSPTAIQAALIVNRVGDADQHFALQMLQFTITELELRKRSNQTPPVPE